MTQLPPSTLTHDHATPERGLTLADRLSEGEEFAVTFGGQGADWFATLAELVDELSDATSRVTHLVEESDRLVAPVAGQLAAALPRPFEPQTWLADDVAPRFTDTIGAALGMPGVWTWGFGEGWGHFYADSVAVNHNAIGRGYETFGNGTAETVDRRIDPSEQAG